MKAYLAITGTLFALLAALHVWRTVVEWTGNVAWVGAATGLLCAVLSVWAWCLFARMQEPS